MNSSSATNVFQYQIQAGNNELVKNEDGSISILNQQGNVLYSLTAPYMYDNNHNISEQVEQNIEKQGNNYILTITANREWLYDKARAYPVIIDPVINSQTDNLGVYIHSVDSDSPSSLPYHYFTVGNLTTTGVGRAYGYLWLPRLDMSESGIGNAFYVQDAKLHFKAQSCNSTVASTLCLQEVMTTIDDFDGMTWQTQPQYSDIVIDSYRKAANTNIADSTLSFDITSLVSKWYRGEPNNGFVIKTENESEAGYFNFDGYEAATPPYLTITYRDLTGVDDDITTLEQDLGYAGGGSIQNATGALTYAFNDYDITGERYPFSISHIYNLANGNTNYGYGFNLNVSSKVVSVDNDTLALVDASGHRSYYDFVSDNGQTGTSLEKYYVSEDDSNNIITYKYYQKYLYKAYTADDSDSDPTNDEGSEVGQIDLFDAATGYLYESRDGQKNSSGSFANRIYFTLLVSLLILKTLFPEI